MFRAPSHAGLPQFSTMLADLPATVPQLARHLNLAPSTIERYRLAGQAPRPVMLAMFWETRWGRSAADCEAANWGAVYYQKAASLERENAALKRQIAKLEAMLHPAWGHAANVPFFRVGS